MASHSLRKLTYEDFVRFPDDGQRHEILDGEHVVSPGASAHHQIVAVRVCTRLDSFVEKHGLGQVLPAPFDVRLSDNDILQPDLLFIAKSRRALLRESFVLGAPDLVVEVLSPATRRRDLGEKRARYERLGVPEYWIFDPLSATAQVLRRQGDGFQPPLLLSAESDDRVTTPQLPGLEISLREVFAP